MQTIVRTAFYGAAAAGFAAFCIALAQPVPTLPNCAEPAQNRGVTAIPVTPDQFAGP